MKPLILDGGLGTLLYSRGAFTKGDPLWSVRCLATPPESDPRSKLYEAHVDFVAAGADVIKTNSYQMSVDHLQKCITGLSEEEAMEMIRDSVRIARKACNDYWQSNKQNSTKMEPKVAGSIGPYGACQADMSEYSGAYADSMTTEDFMEWHRPRLMLLLEEKVDYLAIETFPGLKEARAVLELVRQAAPDVAAWISFSCKDGEHLCHGELLREAVREIWNNKTPGLMAIGINCTDRQNISALLASLGEGGIPLVLYPHRPDDAKTGSDELASYASKWVSIYPNIIAIGGCCGYHPEDITALRKALIDF